MDNAEGSSGSMIEFSDKQRDVLVGTLLGDGCLARHGRYHRLHIKHKAEHEALARFKRDVFRSYVSMQLHRFEQRLGQESYGCVQFASRTSRVFSKWHTRFYRNRRKIVPSNIVELLSPEAVTVWIMDDGAADYARTDLFDARISRRGGGTPRDGAGRSIWTGSELEKEQAGMGRLRQCQEHGFAGSVGRAIPASRVPIQVETKTDSNPVETIRWPPMLVGVMT